MNTISVIKLENIAYKVKENDKTRSVLNNFSLTLERGSTYALLGVSGSGKSTLLHLLAGFQQPTEGVIWYDARTHYSLTEQERMYMRRHVMGYVVQNALLVPELSVIENVMVSGLIAGLSRNACSERAYKLLNQVRLVSQANAYPATLSGGEQQRIAVIRALWAQPAWLLLDEPTAHLDAICKEQMLELLFGISKQYNIGIIVATHDQEIAQAMQNTIFLHVT